jgi:hypothetical protein
MCPHEAAAFLDDLILNLVNEHAPIKSLTIKSPALKWKNAELNNQIKSKNKLYKAFKATGFDKSSSEWLNYKTARNQTVNAIRAAKSQAFKQLLKNSEISLWTKIKSAKGIAITSTKINFLNYNDQLLTKPDDIGNALNDYFSSIGYKLNKTLNTDNQNFPFTPNPNGFSFREVDVCRVSHILGKLNNKKKGGVDQIPAFIYKILEPLILSPLTHIINLSISKSVFPDVWKKALVIPIFKGGDPSLPGNYRPISLLPALSKILEKILASQIQEHLEQNKLINNRQFGFRAGCSTEQLIFQLINKIKSMLSKKESKYATIAALDIKKAFDSVNHSLLVKKLNDSFMFGSTARKLIENYLSNRIQFLKYLNCISQAKTITTGVLKVQCWGLFYS